MSRKQSYEGVATAFGGPDNAAALDIAHNYSLARSEQTVKLVAAALKALGIQTRSPRPVSHQGMTPAPLRSALRPHLKLAPRPSFASGR
jgi:hypothetical protein